MESLDPKYFIQVHNQRHKELVEEAKGNRLAKILMPKKVKRLNSLPIVNFLGSLFPFRILINSK
jgi:hypothetical protein